MTREIPLTQGKVALVDDCDFEYLSQFNWFAHKNKFTWYAQRNSPRVNGKRTVIHMHREILQAPNAFKVDHRDDDGLNNQRGNIRLCTQGENIRNRRVSVTNTSGYKGVHWKTQNKKWAATIHIDGKSIHLGYFKSASDAALVYDAAAREHYGEFARLNYAEAVARGDMSGAES